MLVSAGATWVALGVVMLARSRRRRCCRRGQRHARDRNHDATCGPESTACGTRRRIAAIVASRIDNSPPPLSDFACLRRADHGKVKPTASLDATLRSPSYTEPAGASAEASGRQGLQTTRSSSRHIPRTHADKRAQLRCYEHRRGRCSSSANNDTTADCGIGGCGAHGRGLARSPRRGKTLPRVRSSDVSLAGVNHEMTEHSATFRALIGAINASDGIVYVEAGECGHDVAACLVGVSSAGAYRMLWIKVDKDRRECDLIASIGHELQHAVENPERLRRPMRSRNVSLLHGCGRRSGPLVFETTAATNAGIAVRSEIRTCRSR